MLLQMVLFHSFLWESNIPFYAVPHHGSPLWYSGLKTSRTEEPSGLQRLSMQAVTNIYHIKLIGSDPLQFC